MLDGNQPSWVKPLLTYHLDAPQLCLAGNREAVEVGVTPVEPAPHHEGVPEVGGVFEHVVWLHLEAGLGWILQRQADGVGHVALAPVEVDTVSPAASARSASSTPAPMLQYMAVSAASSRHSCAEASASNPRV